MKLLIEQSSKGESSQVLLRSKLRAVSRRIGFNDVTRERMELACNEMMTNQNKFARGTGVIQLWEPNHPAHALDLFALDYGPGIPDLASAIQDGFTTAKTMGKGLGAIRRLAHESEFYTVPLERARDCPWHGMAVWARFHAGRVEATALPFGTYARAYQDNPYTGDLLVVRQRGNSTRWLHMDGLGHGREAAQAVEGLEDLLDDDTAPPEIVRTIDARLKGRRGAVGLVGHADRGERTLSLSGVGDMSAIHIYHGERRTFALPPGVLGHAHRSIEAQNSPWVPPALLITATDGLRRNWTLRSFPDLWRLAPTMIALVLGQVAGRSNDDKSVFVLNA